MAGRIVSMIMGEIAQSATKGKEFVKKLGERLSPSSIAKYDCDNDADDKGSKEDKD